MIKAKTLIYYDYFDLVKEVERKIGHSLRNLNRFFYPDSNSNSKSLPRMDFWYWQMEYGFHQVQNDSYISLYIGTDINENDKKEEKECWQFKIQQIWYNLFKNIADDDGYLWVWMSW